MSPYLQRKPLNICIVEDNPGDCLLLRELLSDTNIPFETIVECANLASALKHFATGRPDIVFLDLYLPDSVGLASYQALQDSLGNTAVVILSGMSDMQTAHDAIALGAQDYLEKGDFDSKLLERTLLYALERVKSNEKIRLANERYTLVAKATRDLVWDWDLLTNKVYRDEKAVREVFGVKCNKDIEGHEALRSRIHPDDIENFAEKLQEIRQNTGLALFEIEYRFLTDDGNYKNIYDRGYITRDTNGQAVRFIGAAQDITEQRKMEEALRNAEIRTRRAVAAATIRGQEKERKQLGLELHDNITQILATSSLFIDQALSGGDVRAMLLKSRELIVLSTQELRKLSHHLLPPSADFGLESALDKITSDLETTGLVFDKQWDSFDESLLSSEHLLTIYRIIQEQLNNIVKHASANHVLISLVSSQDKKQVKLEIWDDGVGFELAGKRRGVGLRNMTTRADLFNGRVSVNSKPGEGCRLKVVFPLDKEKIAPDRQEQLRPAVSLR